MFRWLLLALGALPLLFSGAPLPLPQNPETSEAGESLRLWAMARTFPDGRFYTEKYAEAMAQMRLERLLQVQDRGDAWEAIGPKNIGGRTLCLAVHPLDTNILYAGSAAGGLWKSTTAGRGAQAWERIETGFPVLGVSAIAIDPQHPNTLYVGTGEVYNLELSMPNVAFRTTRGTYGIGILKSTDGGLHWTKSLDWSYGDLRGVQDIKINPLRPATLYAATSEGLLRSYDAGASWQTVHARSMAVDIEINPSDTTVVFVTHGSLDDENVSGVFRSQNGGNSFELLSNGIATVYSGKAMLSISPSQPKVMYASVGNSFSQEGLYRSEDGGNSWELVSLANVCSYQGWYSHDVTVHPTLPNSIIWTGIDVWKSEDGGASVSQQTAWYAWYFGQVPAGGPEGPPEYVHADIHRAYWQVQDPGKVYCVTDGGIFVSYDGGESWEGRNGGYQTQQFYANLSNSATNPLWAIGGMQDNATAIYTGQDDWARVIGGDGECTAISPLNDQVLLGSYQYLNILKSIDGGQSFYPSSSNEMLQEESCFNGPFEICPSEPNILYAGAQSLFRSDDEGEFWYPVSNDFLAEGDPILALALHPNDPNILLCSTAPLNTNEARVFHCDVTTGTWTPAKGLPNRLCMDIAFAPLHPDTAFAVLAGFNAGHVWRSTDGGLNWVNVDNGLPDIPTNTVLVDPLYPNQVYIGNDLGVWLSRNGGQSWELFSGAAPHALLVMHLSISADRQLRVATHGLGVWQTPMDIPVSANAPGAAPALDLRLSPNPATDQFSLHTTLPLGARVSIRVLDIAGRTVWQQQLGQQPAGALVLPVDCRAWPAGRYGIALEGNSTVGQRRYSGSRVLVKK
ncbi:MAG: hypothetical protein IT260_22705 [Saprospiraceae bacterium]|nr:hypothetical protein [Saprospiraceae bacterium]